MHFVIHHLWHISTAAYCGTEKRIYACYNDSLTMARQYRNMWELIYVINVVSQSAFCGWYIDCKNIHGMNNMKFAKNLFRNVVYLFMEWGLHILQSLWSLDCAIVNAERTSILYFSRFIWWHGACSVSSFCKNTLPKWYVTAPEH